MNRQLTGKMIAAIVMGLLLGIFVNHSYAIWGRRGHDAFMAYQQHRFDRYMATPHTSIGIIITSVFFACLAIFLYELLVLGTSRLLKAPASTSSLN